MKLAYETMISETQARIERTRWNLSQLTPEREQYARNEARKLAGMMIPDEDGHVITFDEWLDVVAADVRREDDKWYCMRCAELGDR